VKKYYCIQCELLENKQNASIAEHFENSISVSHYAEAGTVFNTETESGSIVIIPNYLKDSGSDEGIEEDKS